MPGVLTRVKPPSPPDPVPQQQEGWQRRRALSATIRVFVTVIPVVASFVLGLVGNTVVPAAHGFGWGVTRMAGILVASLVVLAVTDTVARKLLPLAALLQLSLVFPDQTPSRFRLALRSGSGRRLARAVEEARAEGISDEPTRAAEQLLMMASAIGDHDRRTRGHSERVRLYAELIGEELGLDADERAKLQWAALIHDIGKVTVPPEILNKKGKPDDAEWAILKGHPMAGEDLAAAAEPWLGEWVHAVGGHHERWDGGGYPRGLRGEEIPRSAAIVAVADSFEVMTAIRSYKTSMPLADARRELTRCAGQHFSPEVVRAFLNVSIGDLRRSMGILSALAHLPFLGRVSSAAAYAPDTVATAVGATTHAAGAGAGAVAVTTALAVAAPAGTAAAAPIQAPVPVASSAPGDVAAGSPAGVPVEVPEVVDVRDAPVVLTLAAAAPAQPATAVSPLVEQLATPVSRTSVAAPAPRTAPAPADIVPAAAPLVESAASVPAVADDEGLSQGSGAEAGHLKDGASAGPSANAGKGKPAGAAGGARPAGDAGDAGGNGKGDQTETPPGGGNPHAEPKGKGGGGGAEPKGNDGGGAEPQGNGGGGAGGGVAKGNGSGGGGKAAPSPKGPTKQTVTT